MHSFTAPSGRTYHHHGDFSGDVKFDIPEDEAMVYSDGTVRAAVPAADLVALVAEKIRRDRIRTLENLTADEILNPT